MSDTIDTFRDISRAVDVSVICDADTRYNEVSSWMHECEDTDAPAVHMENQVWPSFSLENMRAPLSAALDAHRDPGLVIIARTCVLAPMGRDEGAAHRRTYSKAGANPVSLP
jgi:2-methylisocitrate lyase-like PEP mutase family enzyme